MLRLLSVVLGVILIAGLGLVVLDRPSQGFMTVPEAQAALQQHPATWIGRVVFVRGWSFSWGGQGCAAPRPGGRPAPGSPTCAKVEDEPDDVGRC